MPLRRNQRIYIQTKLPMRSLLIFLIFSLFTALPAYALHRNIEITWDIPEDNGVTPAGFHLYLAGENDPVCSTAEENINTLSCGLDIEGNSATFTLTSYSADNLESAHSSPFTITFDQDLNPAFISAPSSGPAPLPVSFDASTSTGNILRYTWDFGDGTTAIGQQTLHTYDSAADYTVTLSVTDDHQNQMTTTTEIVVTEEESGGGETNRPPTAALAVNPGNGSSPLRVSFDGSGSSDPDGDALTYAWNFGDGSSGSGIRTTHTYQMTGMLTAILTVTDSENATATTSVPILVTAPPVTPSSAKAVIYANLSHGILVQAPVTLSASRSTPSESNAKITRYTWDFGDGSTGSGSVVTHTYTTAGDYSVILTVIDSLGKTASSTAVIHIVTEKDAENLLFLQPVYHLLIGKPYLPAQQLDNRGE